MKGTRLLRSTLVSFGFCVAICGASHAQTAATSTREPDPGQAAVADVESRRVFLYDRIVSFVPPEGFTPPSKEVTRRKFANATSPTTVYANERATTSVAVSYHPLQVLPPEQLPEFKSFMRSSLDKQRPGLEWLKDE